MDELNELNEVLLWLAERQGRISFSISVEDRIEGLEPPAPVIQVEAISVTPEDAERRTQRCFPPVR